MDVSEISCTMFHRVDPAVVAELRPKGREFLSYLCTAPKGPWVTRYIDHPAVNLRLWLWMAYQYGLQGILVWRANYWSSPTVFPQDNIQNPWQDPMSYTVGYGTPYGQANYWGNGDGRFLYPPNREPNKDRTKYLCGPVNSVRWEILREGIEDYEYFRLLERAVREAPPAKEKLARKGRALLSRPEAIFLLDIRFLHEVSFPKVIVPAFPYIAHWMSSMAQQGTSQAVQGTQSVSRAVALLRAVARDNENGARLSNLARNVGLHAVTTRRLLSVLVHEGLLSFDPQKKTYQIGLALYHIGSAAKQFEIRDRFRSTLEKIADQTEDTVFLFVRRGNDAVCIERLRGGFRSALCWST